MSYTGNDPATFMSAATGSNEDNPRPDPFTSVNTRIEGIRGNAKPTAEHAAGLTTLRNVQNLSIQFTDHLFVRPRGSAKQDFPDGTGRGRIKATQKFPGGPETTGMARPSGHDPVTESAHWDYLSNPQGPAHPVVNYPLCSDGQCKGLCGGLCSLAHPQQRRTMGSMFETVNVGRNVTNLANSPSADKSGLVDPEQLRQLKIKQIPYSYERS